MSLVPDLLFRKIGDVVLKGKYESVGLFTPVLDEELNNGLFKEYLNVYQHIEKCLDHALVDLEKAMGSYPNDSLFHFYLERLNSGIQGTKIVMEDK